MVKWVVDRNFSLEGVLPGALLDLALRLGRLPGADHVDGSSIHPSRFSQVAG